MRVLVLGGRGFLGRHVTAALAARGHEVEIGSRAGRRGGAPYPVHRIRFEMLCAAAAWTPVLRDFDAVANCVGILRERGHETYDRVHHLAPAALAAACSQLGARFVHVSALGLTNEARSGFIRSKLRGEAAIRASGADYSIVRPSLLDGEGGYGAKWLRAVARTPFHCVPADARGRIAALRVDDAGLAIARLCELSGDVLRDADLGGPDSRTLDHHIVALRGGHAYTLRVPAPLARIASHLCDLAHVSPFSFGHLELLRRDNVPRNDVTAMLLGRPPRPITPVRAAASARDPAILPPTRARDGGSTRTARAP